MMTTTVTAFRKDLKHYLDKVIQEAEPLIINRGKDAGVVVLSLKNFNGAMDTTEYLMSSKKNEERLDEAIQQFGEGKSFEKELIEE